MNAPESGTVAGWRRLALQSSLMHARPAKIGAPSPPPPLQCYPVDCTKVVANCAACFRLTCAACSLGFELQNGQVGRCCC